MAVVALLAVSGWLRWSGQLPYGSDNDEYVLVAEQLTRLQPPAVAGVEATKYPLGYPTLLAAFDLIGLPVAPAALGLNFAALAATAGLGALAARRLNLPGLAAFAPAAYLAANPALWDSAHSLMPDALLVVTVAGIVARLARISAGGWSNSLAGIGAGDAPRTLAGIGAGDAPRTLAGIGAGGAFRRLASRDPDLADGGGHRRRAAGREPPRSGVRRDVAVVSGLVAVAAALKSVGLLIGLGMTAGLLLLRRRVGRWAWLPALSAAAVTGLSMLATAPQPEHTTGYATTFWLVDPYDASAGRASVMEVAGRVITRAGTYGADVGRALTGPHAPRWPATAVAALLLVGGLTALRRRGAAIAAAAGLVAVYSLGLVLWPYTSVRFGLPLLPLAAVGMAGMSGWAARLAPRAAGAVLVAAVAAYAVWSGQHLAAQARADAANLGALHAATADAVEWVDDHIARGEQLASFDYRELARHLDRPVLPLGYTADVRALWHASGGRGAEWLVVVRGLYPRRERLADALLSAYPDRFQRAYANARIEVYAVQLAGEER